MSSHISSSRKKSNADSNKFLATVIPQLAYLLGEAPPAAEPDAFLQLWEEAMKAVRIRGRHLLLVVDGLDEDLRPPNSPTVAVLLPAMAGGRGHVLVTSRSCEDVLEGVDPGHPLRRAQYVRLHASRAAEEQRLLAEDEIAHLLTGASELANGVFGTMAAAAGPLAIDDLAALLPGLSVPSVRRFLGHAASRIVQSVGPRDAQRFQFAHEALLSTCQEHHDLRVGVCRERIHAWAELWRQAGWPTPAGADGTTPRYLLDAYPGTLHGEPRRLAVLVSDIGWVTAAIQATGVDIVLAELRTARAAAPSHPAVAAVLDAARGQATHLRAPQPVDRPDYVLRQLCLQAAELGEDALADSLRLRLLASADPGLVPRWTSRRASRALIAEVDGGGGWVRAVAALPDMRVASGGDDGRVRLWDPADPQAGPAELGRHAGAVHALAVLPDGRLVSGGHDHRLRLWDPADPQAGPAELGRHDGVVTAIAVTRNGRVASGGDDGRVRLWDPADPQAGPAELGRHAGAVHALAVLPDGRLVSGGHDHRLRLWDPADPQAGPAELGRHDGVVTAIAVTRNGRVASGGDDGRVRLWDPADPQAGPAELGRHAGAVHALAVLPDGRLVSGGHDRRLRLWDPADPQAGPAELGRHDGVVTAIAVTRNGRVASGGTEGRLRVWDPDALAATPGDHSRSGLVSAVAVAPDGRVVSGGRDGRVRVWNPAAPQAGSAEVGAHGRAVRAVAVLPDGRVVSCGTDRRLLVWNPAGPAEFGRHASAALVALSDGRVVSGGYDGSLLMWDPAAPQAPVELCSHDGAVTAVAVLRDGRVASSGHGGRVLVADPADPRRRLVELGSHGVSAVTSVAALPDGRVVSGGKDGRLLVWDPAVPQLAQWELTCHDGWVTSVVALPDGRVISGGTDKCVRVWRVGERAALSVVACSAQVLAAGQSRSGDGILAIAHAGAGLSIWSIARRQNAPSGNGRGNHSDGDHA